MKRIRLTACLFAFCAGFTGCKRDAVSQSAGESEPDTLTVVDSAGPRVRSALVIGNGHYKSLQKLDACPNDAKKMAEAFQRIGIPLFRGKPLIDLTVEKMDDALHDYAVSLKPGSEAFIYYSGHGAQIGGTNYLLPIGFEAKYESQARRQAVSLDSILELLEKTDSKLRVVMLDACRDPGNILPGEPKRKSAAYAKGLSEQKVSAPETLVCFATKDGTASLVDGKESYYTRVLAEEMVKPGEVAGVMRVVARRVYEATAQRQLPFTYGSLLQDHFFVAPIETPVSIEASSQAKPETPNPAILPRGAVGAGDGGAGMPKGATKEAPFVNTLEMKFVPVEITRGKRVLFSVWDTRVQDYAEFAKATNREWEKPGFEQGPTHPAVIVSWEDARAFCEWLTRKEHASGKIGSGEAYRLPSDHEWSCAVGIGDREDENATPENKCGKLEGYPWGLRWPPPKGAGNFADETAKKAKKALFAGYIDGYYDGFAYTSPVGSYEPNRNGLPRHLPESLGIFLPIPDKNPASAFAEVFIDLEQSFVRTKSEGRRPAQGRSNLPSKFPRVGIDFNEGKFGFGLSRDDGIKIPAILG